MGEMITLQAGDGFEFGAYRALPEGTPAGGVLVIQEIFGVNQHIREVTERFAEQGYAAMAPAIFDRIERGVELGYDQQGITRGVELAMGKLTMEEILRDLAATAAELSRYGRVGAVGYCFGGLPAYLSACSVPGLACSVGYYGGGIADSLDQIPRVPLLLHFGERDEHIPMSDVAKIRAALPDVPIHTYHADHGFSCDHRDSFDERASRQALERTLRFFADHLVSSSAPTA